jgi:hypothetical protein
MPNNMIQVLLTFTMLFTVSLIKADALNELLIEYKGKGTSSFSASSGKNLWNKNQQGRSCTTCHTTSVKNTGKHQRTGKLIKPMAPSVNSTRLKNKKKVKKWLLRNCKWTFKRECSAQEKGDILVWLQSQ